MYFADAVGEFGLVRREPAADFAACLSKVRDLAAAYPDKMISALGKADSFDGLSDQERDAVAIVAGQGRRLAVERGNAA
jgi:hypothetical protein